MTFDRKHRDPLQVNPTARLVFATNKLPTFADRSNGMWRRFIPLPCEATVAPEDQDKQLAEKLKGELPGILNWALAGLKRLRQRGCFAVPAASKSLLAEHRGASNPELLFFEDECEVEQGAEMLCSDLHQRYVEWCRVGGHTPLDERQFGKALRKHFSQVDRKRRRREKKHPWVYSGVKCSYCSYVPLLSTSSTEGMGRRVRIKQGPQGTSGTWERGFGPLPLPPGEAE